jgi:uncharacterized protein (TIGR02145 family)
MYFQRASVAEHSTGLAGLIKFSAIALIFFTACKKKEVTPEPIPVLTPKPYYMEPITDIDGNVYHTVKIGNQVWTVENLKTTHYQNGDAIPKVDDYNTWPDLTTGAYCEYGNNAINVESYGRLYNWYVISDSRKIAPDGWRVPTQQDWQTLISFLGDADEAGGKLKETGTSHWESPNSGATDEWGFRALPGGKRRTYYEDIGEYFYCWTSQEVSATQATRSQIYKGASSVIFPNGQKHEGYAIRLIKE